MLTALSATVLAWILAALLLIGIGGVVLRLVGRSIDGLSIGLMAFWLGFAATIALLQTWHVWLPVGHAALLCLVLLSGLGWWTNRDLVAHALRHLGKAPRSTWMAAAGFALLALWLANRALAPITPQGDAGPYHIGAIRWLQAYPLITGLGNLDGKFAFNNAHFLYAALVDAPSGPPHFHHVATPLLFLAWIAQVFTHLRGLGLRGAAAAPHHLLGALSLAGVVPYLFMEFGTTSTDTVNLLIGLVLGVQLFRLCSERLTHDDARLAWMLVVALATIGVTVKLSFVIVGFTATLAATYAWLRQGAREAGVGLLGQARVELTPMLIASSLAGLVLATWAIRGVILSGYLAYPVSSAFGFDVDWRVPAAQVVAEYEAIRVWARYPFDDGTPWHEILGGWSWVGPWLGKTAERADAFTIPMLLFLGGVGTLLARRRSDPGDRLSVALFLVPWLIGFGFWFYSAPAARFGGAIFWQLGAGAWAGLYAVTGSSRFREGIATASRIFIAVTVSIAAIVGAILSNGRYGWSVFVTPGPEAGFHPIPAVRVQSLESLSGLAYNVPVEMGAPTSNWVPSLACWDAPLPCRQFPHPELSFRDGRSIEGGFRLRGGVE